MRPLILKGHTRPLTLVKYNKDGDLLFSSAKDDVPTCWRVSTGARIGTYDGHQGTIWALDVSRDSTRLITAGADQTVKLWVVETGQMLASFQCTGTVRWVEFAEGDNSFIALIDPFASVEAAVRIYTRSENGGVDEASKWTYVEWKTTGVAPGKRLTRALWLPLNEMVVSGDDLGVIRLHDPATGEVKKEIREHTKRINCLSFNADKTLMITGSTDCTSKLFDTKTWRCLKTFETEVPVNAAAISPIKEHCFVAGGQESMNVTTTSARAGKFETKLFHMVFGDQFGVITGHFGPVNTIAIAPDGAGFTSGSEDGYIRIHHFDKEYFAMHSEFDDLDALVAMLKEKKGGNGEEIEVAQ